MGQVRHGSSTTTHAVRAAIQRSQASLATLSRELGINPKTVAKWRKRATVEDLKTGPKAPHSTTLSEAEEAMVVAFRRHTLLPLACPREGWGLPLRVAAIDPAANPVSAASLPPAARHLPSARCRRRQAKAAALQALPDRLLSHGHRRGAYRRRQALPVRRYRSLPAKFAVTRLVDKADLRTAWEFLEYLLKAVPYRIHTILTDNVLCREASAGFGQQISMRRQSSARHAF